MTAHGAVQDPESEADPDSYYAAWDRNAQVRAIELLNNQDAAFLALKGIICDCLAQSMGSSGRILDAGCGVGALTESLKLTGYEVVGIDPSVGAIRQARKSYPDVAFEQGTVERYVTAHADIFDAVVANMVLHTAVDLQGFVQAVSKVLPVGVFVATIPDPRTYLQGKPYFGELAFEYGIEARYDVPFRIRRGQLHPARTPFFHRPIEWYEEELARAGFSVSVNVPPDGSVSRLRDIAMLVAVAR